MKVVTGMNLLLVTFTIDDVQFLVHMPLVLTTENEKMIAIQKAIEANRKIGEYDDGTVLDNPDDYIVKDVDFDLLYGILQRNDWIFKDGDVIAFRD